MILYNLENSSFLHILLIYIFNFLFFSFPSKKSLYVFVISNFNFPGFIFSSCFTIKSTSYNSCNLLTFSFLCPITLFTSIGLTVTLTSFTFTFNFFILSTIASYHKPDSTNCLKAGWNGPATTSLWLLPGSQISSVFCSPTLITSIFLSLNILTNCLHVSTACTTDNGSYVPLLYSFSSFVPFITSTGYILIIFGFNFINAFAVFISSILHFLAIQPSFDGLN